MKKHYTEVDVLKGIAITLVVLGHSIIFFPIDLHEIPWCSALFRFVGFHMPLFFLVSGFSHRAAGTLAEQLIKKTRRLLIPYFVFNLLDSVPRSTLPLLVNRPKPLSECLHGMIFQGGEYWFLYVLFLIFLIFPVISRAMRKKAGAVLVLLLLLSAQRIPGVPTLFLLDRVVYYLFFFAAGYAVREHADMERTAQWVWENRGVCGAGCAVILSGWIAYSSFEVCALGPWGGTLLILLTCGACYLLVTAVSSEKFWRPFQKLGEYSLQIYLLNGFLLVLSRTFTVKLLHCEIPAVIVAVNMLVDLIFSYFIVSRVFVKFKLLRVISGMK